MSVAHEIVMMVSRLKQADIPIDKLAYEVDEYEWQELCSEAESVQPYRDADASYLDDMYWYGLHIRKRSRRGELKT